MRLSEAFSSYKRDVIIYRSQSSKTEAQHNQTMINLIRFLGDIEVEKLSFEDVRRWKLDMENRKLSLATIRGYIIKLRVVLNYLSLKGEMVLQPSLIALPKKADSVPQVCSPIEVQQLINATSKIRNKALISFLYSTGLRVSECCSLDRMHVKEDYFTVLGKGGKSRLCFIDQRTRKLLDEYFKQRKGYTVYWRCHGQVTERVRCVHEADNSPALFINDQKRRMTPGMAQEVFKNARRKAGLPNVHPHTMRHSYATNLLNGGCDVYTISKLLGHASIDTTSAYLHVTNPQLKEAFEKYHSI